MVSIVLSRHLKNNKRELFVLYYESFLQYRMTMCGYIFINFNKHIFLKISTVYICYMHSCYKNTSQFVYIICTVLQ